MKILLILGPQNWSWKRRQGNRVGRGGGQKTQKGGGRSLAKYSVVDIDRVCHLF